MSRVWKRMLPHETSGCFWVGHWFLGTSPPRPLSSLLQPPEVLGQLPAPSFSSSVACNGDFADWSASICWPLPPTMASDLCREPFHPSRVLMCILWMERVGLREEQWAGEVEAGLDLPPAALHRGTEASQASVEAWYLAPSLPHMYQLPSQQDLASKHLMK